MSHNPAGATSTATPRADRHAKAATYSAVIPTSRAHALTIGPDEARVRVDYCLRLAEPTIRIAVVAATAALLDVAATFITKPYKPSTLVDSSPRLRIDDFVVALSLEDRVAALVDIANSLGVDVELDSAMFLATAVGE